MFPNRFLVLIIIASIVVLQANFVGTTHALIRLSFISSSTASLLFLFSSPASSSRHLVFFSPFLVLTIATILIRSYTLSDLIGDVICLQSRQKEAVKNPTYALL